jgi:hypothetical protein
MRASRLAIIAALSGCTDRATPVEDGTTSTDGGPTSAPSSATTDGDDASGNANEVDSAAASSEGGATSSTSGGDAPLCVREPSGSTLGESVWSVLEPPGVWGNDITWTPSGVVTIGSIELRGYDHEGALAWTASWDAPGEHQTSGERVVALDDGTFAAVWSSDARWLVRHDGEGAELWRYALEQMFAPVLLPAVGGGVLVIGSQSTRIDPGLEQRIVEVDAAGEVIRDTRFGLRDHPIGILRDADFDDAGGLLLAGANASGFDLAWGARLDSAHEIVEIVELGEVGDVAIASAPGGDVVVYEGGAGSPKRLWQGELSGERDWEIEVHQVFPDDLEVDCDGRVYLAFGGVTSWGPDGTELWQSEGIDVNALVLDPAGRMFTVGGAGPEGQLQLSLVVAR